jgi:hypothetical protein
VLSLISNYKTLSTGKGVPALLFFYRTAGIGVIENNFRVANRPHIMVKDIIDIFSSLNSFLKATVQHFLRGIY